MPSCSSARRSPVGWTWLAAGHTVPVINVVIFGLALVCVVLPDSHFGLLVVLLISVFEWWWQSTTGRHHGR